MKLKNKKTGDIIESYIIETASAIGPGLILQDNDTNKRYQYNSLAELNAEWEDAPEEPKDVWWLDNEGNVNYASRVDDDCFKKNKQIGNYFSSREEAELAVRKLEAWKRLKDKGFKFGKWKFTPNCDGAKLADTITINASMTVNTDDFKDLDLLFGGEE